MGGHVIDTVNQETILTIRPNEDPDEAVIRKQWEIKIELERKLWLRFIARCQGQQ